MRESAIKLALLLILMQFTTPLFATTEPVAADILFARYYVNWASGFEFKGMTVDSAGQVYSFEYGASDNDDGFSNNSGKTAEQLDTFYKPGRQLITTVTPDELQQMIELIPHAAVGSFSERVNEAYDMGTFAWVGYNFNPQTSLFQTIDLKQSGDWCSHNLATSAAALVVWLDRLAVAGTKK
ncbi:MAG: hypothetical protein KKB51_13855 [Candidatus Riflebacteria bacterium]|nr:hypothetical protein [Candidatus Riflebacteria bacterium]